jgi:ribonuclease-3
MNATSKSVFTLKSESRGLLAQLQGLRATGFTPENYRVARDQVSDLLQEIAAMEPDVDRGDLKQAMAFDDVLENYEVSRNILNADPQHTPDDVALPPYVEVIGVWDPAPRVRQRRQKAAMHMAAVNLPRLIAELQKTSPIEQRAIDAAVVARAEGIIGRRFRKKFFLRMALTQASAKTNIYPSYERLETLGDAVLNVAVVKALYLLEPWLSPDEITARKSHITANVELARRTRMLGLDKLIFIAPGQNLTENIEADVYEAIVGALFLDGGMLAASKFVLRDLEPLITSQVAENAKSKLTRVMDAVKKKVRYRPISATGPEHDKTWTVIVTIEGRKFGEGIGKTKQEAEQNAATAALSVMDAMAAIGRAQNQV